MGNKYLLYEKRGKELMIKTGFDANKIFVIYNSLDYEVQKEYFENYQKNNIQKEFTFFKNSKLKTVLFLGRLTPVKKIDLLIKSLYRLNSKRINFNLLIVGEGSQKSSLKKISKEGLKKGWIYFYGKKLTRNPNYLN